MSGPAEISSQLPLWFTSALQDDRVALLRSDAFRSFAFAFLAFGTLWLTVIKDSKPVLAVLAITIFILIDSWNVDSRFISKDNYQRNPSELFFTETDVDKAIQMDEDLEYRVYNLQGAMNEARTSYFHHSLGGYHGAKMRRYQDFYENVIQNETRELINMLQSGDTDFSHLGGINMLNTKYFYVGSSITGVFRNESPNGNAWLVKNVQTVNSPDEELSLLTGLNTKTTAVIDNSKFKQSKTTYNSEGTVALTSYAPDKLTYAYSSETPSLAVFSEIYYPKGWIATIDGSEIPILRANYILRALDLPSGNHTIEFRFVPDVYTIGNKITAVFCVLVILILVGSIYFDIKQRATESTMSD